MTVEKAIEILSDVGDINKCCAEDAEALDMAIKALEAQSCEDCISREATIDAIYKKYIGGKDAIENAPINDLYADGLKEAVDAVWDMPSVTPKQKTGRWIDIQYFKADDTYYRPKCPFCSIEPKEYSNYCPNCGARMEAETKIEQGLNFADQDTMMPAT